MNTFISRNMQTVLFTYDHAFSSTRYKNIKVSLLHNLQFSIGLIAKTNKGKYVASTGK